MAASDRMSVQGVKVECRGSDDDNDDDDDEQDDDNEDDDDDDDDDDGDAVGDIGRVDAGMNAVANVKCGDADDDDDDVDGDDDDDDDDVDNDVDNDTSADVAVVVVVVVMDVTVSLDTEASKVTDVCRRKEEACRNSGGGLLQIVCARSAATRLSERGRVQTDATFSLKEGEQTGGRQLERRFCAEPGVAKLAGSPYSLILV
jgi:hypothetical protein